MKPLSPQTVNAVVKTWDIMFGGKRSIDEIDVLTAKFYQTFRSLFSDKEFLLAAEMAEKETKFFPTIKEIIDCKESVQQVIESRPADYNLPALTDDAGDMSPEVIEQNEKRLQVIKDMLCGKMSMGDAVNAQEKMKVYAKEK